MDEVSLDHLVSIHDKLSIIINKTPTGEDRNTLTDVNMILMQCIADKGLK